MLYSNNISLWHINQEPPQLWCEFERSKVGPIVSVLAIFNTTHCPYSSNDPTTIGGTNVICESYFAYQLMIGAGQYEKATANITLFSILLLISAFSLLCIGWCAKFRN